MRAIVRREYGPPDVLRLEDVPTPSPTGDQVLVRVHAASVNAGDRHMMRGRPLVVRIFEGGLLRPKNPGLGWDLAGVVEAVGPAVTRLAPGDELFGCAPSAFAEFACVSERKLAGKPAGASFEEAAAVPTAALTALQALRDEGGVRAGTDVLVTGASGGVGSFAVQLAGHFGARVTGVARTEKLEMVRSLGAERVIDYTRDDFTDDVARYDLILDAAAYRPVRRVRRSLKPGGRYVMVGGSMGRMLEALLLSASSRIVPDRLSGGRRTRVLLAKVESGDLEFLRGLVEAGDLVPSVDRAFTLREVPDAIRYLESGRARGKVAITV